MPTKKRQSRRAQNSSAGAATPAESAPAAPSSTHQKNQGNAQAMPRASKLITNAVDHVHTQLKGSTIPVTAKRSKRKSSKTVRCCRGCCIFVFTFVILAILTHRLREVEEVKPIFDSIAQELRVNEFLNYDWGPRPGEQLSSTLKLKHPVIMVPGVISSGLEIWEGLPCAKNYFRERLWGSVRMMERAIVDRECWLKHMMLDVDTGLDPAGIRVRAAGGLEAADYFMPGFWIWGRLIENLADIGYDVDSLYMAPYDWRLSFDALERRDRYFTKLKHFTEMAVAGANGEKAMFVTHSMGSLVVYYFLSWVEAPLEYGGGGGGYGWVDRYVSSFVNIAGPLLGAPKALSALLSGEMRDTAQLGTLGEYLVDSVLSKKQRAVLFRSWGSLPAMLPKGGAKVWTPALDGQPLVAFVNTSSKFRNMDADAAVQYVHDVTGHKHHSVPLYHTGVLNANELSEPDAEWRRSRKHWTNPLASQLPNAPNMTIFCLYGVGKDTEVAYYYRENDASQPKSEPPGQPGEHGYIPLAIDKSVNDRSLNVVAGVRSGEGDGTVPLVSLGYMCVKGWKPKGPHNPAGLRVVTKEYKHAPLWDVTMRGGPTTAEHVDIMGNYEMTGDVLKIASGHGDEVENRFVSNIRTLADQIALQ